MTLEMFKESLKSTPIVKKEDYHYFVHPITDGIPKIEPVMLKEITSELKKQISKLEPIDKIVTMEAMGIPLATSLSLATGIPFTIIRKRSYGFPDEISVDQITGYSKSELFINNIEKGERIVIVDDVLSTGGTLKAVLTAFKNMGVSVKGVFIAVNKGNNVDKISKEFDVTIKTLVNVDIKNDKVIIKE